MYLNFDFLKGTQNQDVKLITVPQLEEFSLKTVYPKFKKNTTLAPYLPDLKEKKLPDYTWFYNVINYFTPTFFFYIYFYRW